MLREWVVEQGLPLGIQECLERFHRRSVDYLSRQFVPKWDCPNGVLPKKVCQKIFGRIFQVRFATGRVFKMHFSLRTSFHRTVRNAINESKKAVNCGVRVDGGNINRAYYEGDKFA